MRRVGIAQADLPQRHQRGDDPVWLGRYRIVHQLGAGGMGIVYLAHDRDGIPVAIKTLHRHMCADPVLRRRFAGEIAAAGRASGHGAPQLLAADPYTRHPYLITEFVPGPSVHDWVSTHGPLTPAGIRRLAIGLAHALAAVHSTGVAHRDLKPANVILSPSGPRIIDFGAATVHSTAPRKANEVSFGTLAWMSPEQVAGKPVGRSSDVYCWGLLVLWAATGQPPAATVRGMPPEADLQQLPQQVRPAVRAALRRDPGARPTAAQLLAALTCHTLTRDKSPPGYATAGSRRNATKSAAPTRRLSRRARSRGGRRSRPWRRFLTTLLVAAVLVSAWALAGGNQKRPPTPGPPAAPAPPADPAAPHTSGGGTVTDGALTFTLTSHRCGLTELRSGLLHTSADGQFCLLQVDVRNNARYPAWAIPASQYLIDDAGHQHTANTTAWIYHPPARALLRPVNPDATITGTLVFDIPADANPSLLVVHDTPLSRGTPMAI